MKLTFIYSLLAALCCVVFASELRAQVSAFTYQGRLNLNGSPANGSYDFMFRLLNAPTNGVAAPVIPINPGVAVTNGLFTIGVDFGAENFTGANLWLEISVRTNGGGAFITLAPRQLLTSTPYAVTASNLSGTLPVAQLTGTVPNAQLSASVSLLGQSIDSSEITDGTITTNDLSATVLNSTFWKLGGNTGANPTNGVFLGATDNQPLEFKVNNQRGLRLEFATNANNGESVNVIGGYRSNVVSSGVVGATISGGGAAASVNQVTADFGTVGGGSYNSASGTYATVGGGIGNTATQPFSVVGSGWGNTASGVSAVVGGGLVNQATNDYAMVGGGQLNIAGGAYATIGGGFNNIASGAFATVPGGDRNVAGEFSSFAAGHRAMATNQGAFVWADTTAADFTSTSSNQFLIRASGGVAIGTNDPAGAALRVAGSIKADSYLGMGSTLVIGTTDNQPLEFKVNNQRGLRLEYATNANNGESVNVIVGSRVNFVSNSVVGATIAGGGQSGETNKVTANFGTVGGGRANHAGATVATVAGGQGNDALGYGATVSGGQNNTAIGQLTTIGGGTLNMVTTDYATVSGGFQNTASGLFATAGGGYLNTASGDSATVGGGYFNTASKDYSTVGGGHENTASGVEATVGGGYNNTASGYDATVGGGDGNTAINFESTVGGGNFNTASGPFSTVSGGGSNGATNDFATVGGGYQNTASGYYATIPGGDNNLATNRAFAAGHRAKANHTGAFVWADSTDADFASTGDNQFLIRASGGVAIGTNDPAGAALRVVGTVKVDSTVTANSFAGSGSSLTGVAALGAANTFLSDNTFLGLISANTVNGTTVNSSTTLRVDTLGQNDGTFLDPSPRLAFGGSASSSGEGIASKRTSGGNRFGLDFYTSYNPRMSILNNGNVVIGATTDPQPSFNARLSVKAKTDSGQVIVAYDRNGIELLQVFDPLASPGEATLIVHGGAAKSDGNVFWTLFSDRRLKQDVVPYSKGLAEIARLETVRFRYKDEPKLGLSSKTENIGAIAQDVREVFPEAVTEGQDGYLQMNLNAIEWASINAIKELDANQRELRAEQDKQIGELKAENAELKARLERLEQLVSQKLN